MAYVSVVNWPVRLDELGGKCWYLSRISADLNSFTPKACTKQVASIRRVAALKMSHIRHREGGFSSKKVKEKTRMRTESSVFTYGYSWVNNITVTDVIA